MSVTIYRQRLTKHILLLFAITLALLIGQLLFTPRLDALSGSQFNAGQIIDDAVFYNKSSMSVGQIQAFLDAKVPVCDTNGTQSYAGTTRAAYGISRGYPPPFTCLKDYSQNIQSVVNSGSDLCGGSISGGAKSAAQIIYDVAAACNVNPQVLIVLLQKEQSLVTDDWPWSIQYRSATGYGCPDTAPCDSDYYGFFNQVYQAAKAYRRYRANPANYNYRAGRNNTILWHPNSSCGSSTVYIQNQATAGLYVYTPYRPNQAALNNLYGTGDSCSSYGNRNFWRMFSDWFGPTHGSLIRTASSSTLYFTDGIRKYTVPSMIIAEQYGLSLNDVRFVTQQEIDALPLASSPYTSRLGTLIKSGSDSDDDGKSVYLVSGGKKIPISSWSTLAAYGYSGEDITYMSLESINRLTPTDQALTTLARGDSATVYKIENGKKRIVFEISKLKELATTEGNTTQLSEFTLSYLGYGPPMVDGDYVIKAGAGIRVYNGLGYLDVNNMNIYRCWDLSAIKTFNVSSFLFTNGTKTDNLSCVAEDSSGDAYIISSPYRFPLPDDHGLATSTPSDTLINSLAVQDLNPVLKGSGSTLAAFENGTKRPIPSMKVFNDLGFVGSDIATVPDAVFSSIPLGPYKLSPGTLVSQPSNSTISVITDEGFRRTVGSADQFNSFNFSWSEIISVNTSTINNYQSQGGLPSVLKTTTETYLVDGGIKYVFDPGLDSHFNINRTSLITINDKVLQYLQTKAMTRFVKGEASSTIYYVENGQKRPISSWQALIDLGGQNKIIHLGQSYINSLQTGSTI